MGTKHYLSSKFLRAALRVRLFGRAERAELKKTIHEGETLQHTAYGYYHGGSALLAITSKRVLLIDKKAFFLNIEELPLGAITQLSLSCKPFFADIRMKTQSRNLVFTSLSDASIRKMHTYLDMQIREIRLLGGGDVERKPFSYYKHPAWTPHTPYYIIRRRPTKFHVVGRTALQS